MSLENPTGDAYIPNCIMKGTIYLKSRYLTLRAENNKPAPKETIRAINKNNGINTIFQLGTNLYHTIIIASNIKDIKKSINATIIELAGIIILGKYILDIMFELATRLLLESESAPEKNCHGSSAVNTSMGYGANSEGSFAILPKTIEKASIVSKGQITDQATPITVCLYLTNMSLQERK